MTVTKSVASVGSIEELIDLTERLTELMAQETEILNGMRPSEIGSLQSEKASLSIAYSDAVGAANSGASNVASARMDLRESLARTTARLQDAMADNLRAITIARAFNERLVRALGEAVIEQRHPATAYTADGQRLFSMNHVPPTAMTLDDRI